MSHGAWTSSPLPVVIATAALVAAVSLAYASPGDPTWVTGVYDDADGDDAVVALTDTMPLKIPSRPATGDASAVRGARIGPYVLAVIAAVAVRSSVHLRAPPSHGECRGRDGVPG